MDKELEVLVETISGAIEMMTITGLDSTTVALFFAEGGDITNYNHPQQLVNLAGFHYGNIARVGLEAKQGFQKEHEADYEEPYT